MQVRAYSAIANQESLSGLETEMRKLEGLVKEVVDEMNYLKKREERFTKTNCAFPLHDYHLPLSYTWYFPSFQFQRTNGYKTLRGFPLSPWRVSAHGKSSTCALSSRESTSLTNV